MNPFKISTFGDLQSRGRARRPPIVYKPHKVKKPKRPFPTEVTAPLSSLLVLISIWLSSILTHTV